jgi:hypothetical protein
MCPAGLALHHPAAPLLKEWATYSCPTQTGQPWTTAEMQEVIDCGPHRSALSEEAIAHFKAEVEEKVKSGQAKLVSWDSIKANPPENLKISPIAAIPHKSKQFRSILDLSFHLRLKQGGVLPSVNSATVKTAPKGAIDQLGHSLSRIIHAFAETDDDAVIFMAIWDIKDGFWRLDAGEGAEYNFSYVMPQPPAPGSPTMLVVPTLLQMGWVRKRLGTSRATIAKQGSARCRTINSFHMLSGTRLISPCQRLRQATPRFDTSLKFTWMTLSAS